MQKRAVHWWIHGDAAPRIRKPLQLLNRYVATPTVSKYRLFVWLSSETLPDHQLIVFARNDDYTFGVLHSRVHELWALATGSQLESRPTYTPTTTFETFPLPEPTPDQRETIAEAAKRLNELRERWMNPPEGSIGPSELKQRTLTNLYNERPTWLETAHNRLDKAVSVAYGWDPDLPADEILSRLMSLNLQREPTKAIPESREDD